MRKILIWDWPVRIGHWLLAAGFALAWLTAESESLHLVHIISGAIVLGVATFRLLWGLVGSRYARFSDFVRGPGAVKAYLLSVFKRSPPHYLGHNPAGGWAIVAMLTLAIATSVSGWGLDQELFGEWFEEVHEALASIMLAIVCIHISAVIGDSLLHGENLARAMVSGTKTGDESKAIVSAHPLASILLLLWLAGLVWLLAFQ